MEKSSLRDMSKAFAKDIILFVRGLKLSYNESSLSNQLIRAGTSIGANIHEAQYAQSKKDFISKLEIAQKECFETEYWLELMAEINTDNSDTIKKLQNNCGTIRRMLVASLKTLKNNQNTGT
ncbi:MAG: four helix bundle protein [Clostridia bacterium]|nr:four helix bundle protein [Clostridia bacterium]